VTGGSSGANPAPPRTRFLLDTNAFIALEPYAGQMEAGLAPAAVFLRLAMRQGHQIFVHPASQDELVGGSDPTRAQQRIAELGKYEMLVETPINSYLQTELGPVVADSNDHRDLRILASLHANSVTFLVSDDGNLRKRAKRIGIGQRVLTVADAAAMLESFEPTVAPPPPRVTMLPAYALDLDQEIFDSIRSDYADFNNWIGRVQADSDNRECYVVQEHDGTYAAVAILKLTEDDCAYEFAHPVTKISTFKVAQAFSGNHYGELLLKAVLLSHHDHHVGSAYVEVWDHHQRLIDFLGNFGYFDGGQSPKGERALVKEFQQRDQALDPLAFHIRYGPPAVSPNAAAFAIPIRDRWHNQLFPECASVGIGGQMALPDIAEQSTRPWGNSLRKAYLCNASTNRVQPGDAILFYRSGFQTVAVVGVTEEAQRLSSADEILNLVGGRTVYSPSDIEELAQHPSGVLVILFRQDWIVEPPWALAELQANEVLRAPPQTVMRVKEAGTQWIHQQLADR
jgi:hypothetical protein